MDNTLQISTDILSCDLIGQVVAGQTVVGAGIDFGRGHYLLAGDKRNLRLYDVGVWEEVPPLVIPDPLPIWR